MSGGEDGYTYVNPDDHPDYTTEYILENKIQFNKSPKGTLGELVQRNNYDFAQFLSHYQTSEVGGHGHVEGLTLSDPIKQAIRSIDQLYRDGYTSEDLYILVGEMARLATDPYSIKVAEIYRDFIDYLRVHHEPADTLEASELSQLAETAQQLGEIATLQSEVPTDEYEGSTAPDVEPTEPVIELPEPTTTLEESVSLTGPLTPYEDRLFREMTDDLVFDDTQKYIERHDLPLPIRLPRENPGAHRARRNRH